MKHLHQLADKVRRGEPLPPYWGVLLTALTPVTRIGMQWRLSRPRTRVDAHVVSFGNITAGGTGKTPAVIERARAEVAAGRHVAVLTRGYATADTSSLFVAASDCGTDPGIPHFVGDEPALILRSVPNITLIKGVDRVSAAQEAVERYGCDVLLLDDGFQYVLLERDENIVLIDATNPFGNGRIIPRGILREPVTALERASQIMLTRCDQVRDIDPLLNKLKSLAPGIPVRLTRHVPTGLWRTSDNAPLPLSALKGHEIEAACAIGNPEAFFRTLERLGARLVRKQAYPDHASFEITSKRPVVVTEKDAVRLSRSMDNVWALAVELQDMP